MIIGGKVMHAEKGFMSPFSQVANDAILPIGKVDPFKTGIIRIALPESAMLAVEVVELFDQVLDAMMGRKAQQKPLQFRFAVPLIPLGDFAAHEEQLFPRLADHVAVEEAHIGKFLPEVARHLADQALFAMDHFIVRKDEDKALRKGVEKAKGEVVMMVVAKEHIF